MSYIPRANSLAGRVCAYLKRHPDERLSAGDIAVKFDLENTNVVATNLAAALSAKLLLRIKSGGKDYEYAAGPGLVHYAPAVASPFPSVPPPMPKPKRSMSPPLDTSAVGVEANVPLPPARHATVDWAGLFDRFTAPGMCSSPLPLSMRTSVTSAAKKHFPARGWSYAVRAVSATQLRIWRTA